MAQNKHYHSKERNEHIIRKYWIIARPKHFEVDSNTSNFLSSIKGLKLFILLALVAKLSTVAPFPVCSTFWTICQYVGISNIMGSPTQARLSLFCLQTAASFPTFLATGALFKHGKRVYKLFFSGILPVSEVCYHFIACLILINIFSM